MHHSINMEQTDSSQKTAYEAPECHVMDMTDSIGRPKGSGIIRQQ